MQRIRYSPEHPPVALDFLHGPGKAPTLVFLHGLADCAEVWQPTVDSLHTGNEVVAFDLPGHGTSRWLSNDAYSVVAMIDVVRNALASLARESFVLIGHSLGARICLGLYPAFAASIRGLVLVDFAAQSSAAVAEALRSGVAPLLRSFRSPREFVETLNDIWPFAQRELIERIAASNLMRTKDGAWRLRTDPAVAHLIAPTTAATTAETLSSIATLACPMAVIRGEYSGVVPMAAARALADAAPGCEGVTVIPGAGHNVPAEGPAALAQTVRTLLKNWASWRMPADRPLCSP